jgi:hypothetical protein
MNRKGTALLGTVAKIVESPTPGQPDTAYIAVEDGRSPVQEIRIKNTFGDAISLKLGAPRERSSSSEAKA